MLQFLQSPVAEAIQMILLTHTLKSTCMTQVSHQLQIVHNMVEMLMLGN
jgi:hypothetical protein